MGRKDFGSLKDKGGRQMYLHTLNHTHGLTRFVVHSTKEELCYQEIGRCIFGFEL